MAMENVLFTAGHASNRVRRRGMPGLEGEFVNIREKPSAYERETEASLIEYTQAWCVNNGVVIHD